jgi:hypothetical protein
MGESPEGNAVDAGNMEGLTSKVDATSAKRLQAIISSLN